MNELYCYLLKRKKEFSIIIMFALISSIISIYIPLIYGYFFDNVNNKLKTDIIIYLITLLLNLIVIKSILDTISNYISSILSFNIIADVEKKIYTHWISLPLSFHKKTKFGKMLNIIERGINSLENSIRLIPKFIPEILTLILAIISIFIISIEIGIIIILLLSIYLFISNKLINSLNNQDEKMHWIWDKMYGKIYDKIRNYNLIKIYSSKKRIQNELNSLFIRSKNKYVKLSKKRSKFAFIIDTLLSVYNIVILGITMILVNIGYLSQGKFIMIFGYTNLIFYPFLEIIYSYRELKLNNISINKLLKFLVKKEEGQLGGNKKIKNFKGKIEFKNVYFSYNKKTKVLKDINFIIRPGEKIALIGKSGSGKSTIINLILKYYAPLKGKILLDNINIKNIDVEWLRSKISLVPQDITLFNDTILNNLKFANPKATKKEIIKACKLANAYEFIKKLPNKFNTLVGEYGSKLSAGQKQRIAIAMAFLRNPKIIILDEPTSSLDNISEEKVKKGLNNLFKNKTVIVIAHRLSTIKNMDKIIVLNKGKIIEEGNHDDLINKKGIYYKMIKKQL